MIRVLLLFLVLAAAAAAYLFMNRSTDLPGLLSPSPPAQQADSPETLATPQSEPQVEPQVIEKAREHINQITAAPEHSIDIQKADHFVTALQLLELPLQQTEGKAVLEVIPDKENQAGANGIKTFGVDTGAGRVATASTEKVIVGSGVELSRSNRIKLQELLDRPEASSKQVYYIHAVNEGDEQGLWGILQTGLTRTFAEGIALGDRKAKLYVEIPEEADEKLANQLSSFLGKVLQRKVQSTYIYNYRSGRLGDDPNLIAPGQQLIIVEFSEDELIRVYNHFITQ